MKFKVVAGKHIDGDGREYLKDDIFESDEPMDTKFKGKFLRLDGKTVTKEASRLDKAVFKDGKMAGTVIVSRGEGLFDVLNPINGRLLTEDEQSVTGLEALELVQGLESDGEEAPPKVEADDEDDEGKDDEKKSDDDDKDTGKGDDSKAKGKGSRRGRRSRRSK